MDQKNNSNVHYVNYLKEKLLRHKNDIKPYTPSEIVHSNSFRDDHEVCVIGVFKKVFVKETRHGEKIAIGILSDYKSEIFASLFPNEYEKFKKVVSQKEPLLVYGQIVAEKDENKANIIVSSVVDLRQEYGSSKNDF